MTDNDIVSNNVLNDAILNSLINIFFEKKSIQIHRFAQQILRFINNECFQFI